MCSKGNYCAPTYFLRIDLTFCSMFSIHNKVMKNRIIQWNCRGLKANYEETLLLLNPLVPHVSYMIHGMFLVP